MTPEEQAKRVKNVMSGRPAEMTQIDKVILILDWFNERPDLHFDTRFVEEMEKKIQLHGELTENQEMAIDNIIDSWHIHL